MNLLRLTTAVALGAASLMMTVGGALAVEAMAKAAVNVRTGPGTTYGIVDQLTAGEAVNITECAPVGWCFVEHDGPDGWVSANYLTAPEDEEEEIVEEGSGDNPDCSFGFNIGPSGPSLSINCGDAPLPAPPAPPPIEDDEAQACFFAGNNFNGQRFCMGVGTRNALNATFNDRISSVELTGGVRARLCDGPNLTGYCRNVNNDTAPLVPQINNKASSLVVFVGAPPAPEPLPVPLPTPVTFSTGLINLQQTYTANLDNGTTGGNAGADIWYQAVTSTVKYITPRNGARIAVGDGTNRGFAGCSVASYSAANVPLGSIPVGTYVCVKTNQNRISQFRVNGFAGTTMKLGYTTWAN